MRVIEDLRDMIGGWRRCLLAFLDTHLLFSALPFRIGTYREVVGSNPVHINPNPRCSRAFCDVL